MLERQNNCGLKSILRRESTVGRKYSKYSNDSPLNSAKPQQGTNNKKKKKKAVKVPIIATKETTIHWADQSYGGQLERVELYSSNLWLAESKPSIAHLPRTAAEIKASKSEAGPIYDVWNPAPVFLVNRKKCFSGNIGRSSFGLCNRTGNSGPQDESVGNRSRPSN